MCLFYFRWGDFGVENRGRNVGFFYLCRYMLVFLYGVGLVLVLLFVEMFVLWICVKVMVFLLGVYWVCYF